MLSTTINALTADRRPDRQCRMGSSLVGRQQYNKKDRDMKITDEELSALQITHSRQGDARTVAALAELIALRMLVIQLNAKLEKPVVKEAETPKVEFDQDGDWPPPLRQR